MDAEFVSIYIAECARIQEDPIAYAKKEIEEIDIQLNKAEELKVRRMKLLATLEHLGDDTYRRRRVNAIPSSDDIDISSDDIKELLVKIRNEISKAEPITMRDLINKVGGWEQDSLIMRAVKWLGNQEIVSRDKDGNIQRGKNWKASGGF